MRLNIAEWASEMLSHVRSHPARAPLYLAFTLYLTLWYAVTSRRPFGTNVYDADWDLLIVLDACRVDTLCEVADEYEFIDDVESRWSVGSQSAEWLANTFTSAHETAIAGTTYVSANGYSDSVLVDGTVPPANNTIPVDLSSWSVVREPTLDAHLNVWMRNHDDRYGTVPPRVVSDHVIEAGRSGDPDRLVAHYIQPHLPYTATAYREGRDATEIERRGYELLERGQVSRKEVYGSYMETLRWVLDDVQELLENVDAEQVLITADHGEAFGEWKAYGHPEGFPHPAVRKVPWVETTARDEHTRCPDIETDVDDAVNTDVAKHLEDLGYR